MTRRTSALILGLAALAGGCTVTTHHEPVRVAYPDDRRVIHEDDAYEGYYYVRIVYLGGVPWYVDDDLRARPIPPHLRGHFRYAAWSRSMPPRFGHDQGMRDGYRLSRIVYIDGVPHHVDEHRHARPLPTRVRSRFAYESVARHDGGRRGSGERAAPPFARSGNEARPLPPAVVREREESSGFGAGTALERAAERARAEARPFPPAYGREREQPRVREADHAPGRMMPPGQMHEAPRPLPPAAAREREDASGFGGGTALGRAAERARAAARPSPVPAAAERPQPSAAASDRSGHRMAQAPVREDDRRQAPPAADNRRADDRRVDKHDDRLAAREHGRDERPQQGGAQRERRLSAGDARPRGVAAANERKAEAAPGRKNGKGKGRDDDAEGDSADARDGDAAQGRGRDDQAAGSRSR